MSRGAWGSTGLNRSVRPTTIVGRTTAVGLTATLTLLLSACGEASSPTEEEVLVRDSAGIRIVENRGSGAWGPGGGLTLRETLRLGVDFGDPELQFGTIAGVDTDGEGRIYVLDGQAARVRVFSREGELLRAFGSPGQGPGELSVWPIPGSGGLSHQAGGRLLIPDMGNRRFAYFTGDGEWIRGSPIPMESGFPMDWKSAPDGELFRIVRAGSPNAPAGGQAGPIFIDRLERLDLSGGDAEEQLTYAPDIPLPRGDGRLPPFPQLTSPEVLWTPLAGGRLVTSPGDRYELRFHGPQGTVQQLVRLEAPLRPVSPADEAAVGGHFLQAVEDDGMPPAMLEQVRNNLVFPAHWPAVRSLLAGPDDTVWVGRMRPDDPLEVLTPAALRSGGHVGLRWDVFQAEGTYLGQVTLPPGVRPLRFVGQDLYGIHMDELEIQRVVRLELI